MATNARQHDHTIDGSWREGRGDELIAIDPTTGEPSWHGRGATNEEVDAAVRAARDAFDSWASLPLEDRIAHVKRFSDVLKKNETPLLEAICISTGKPRWEATTEVAGLHGKIGVSIQAYAERCGTKTQDVQGYRATTQFRPHGVCAVLGPFNLPAHLPHGHIVPALIAGNTIVFKPSEQTPLVGNRMMDIWHDVGLPKGVINMVQGGRDTGIALSQHAGIDGLFFTGSSSAGLALCRTFAEHPERILALEMGGNNPLIVDTQHLGDLDAAAYLTVQSAYITAGQRCTCARRLIVIESAKRAAFIERLVAMTKRIRVGKWNDEPQPFYGPVISAAAAKRVIDAQAELVGRGADVLLACKAKKDCPAMLSPGLIDVTGVPARADEEVFGPLLQIMRVKDLDEAITEANDTQFGLSAGLLSDRRGSYDAFARRIRAGVIAWNRQTTGASGQLPFGGVGKSGNHRPAGYFSADYCSYPVAVYEADQVTMPSSTTPGL
ncbi:MAG: succinylglutamate-semialdehyde dehydrogenase [Phycisphaeraceae bacterium]